MEVEHENGPVHVGLIENFEIKDLFLELICELLKVLFPKVVVLVMGVDVFDCDEVNMKVFGLFLFEGEE